MTDAEVLGNEILLSALKLLLWSERTPTKISPVLSVRRLATCVLTVCPLVFNRLTLMFCTFPSVPKVKGAYTVICLCAPDGKLMGT